MSTGDNKFSASGLTNELSDVSTSINYSLNGERNANIVWRKAPINSNPVFVHAIISPSDIKQGPLGNDWFVAAMFNLQRNPNIFSIVVPEGQDFEENYDGTFCFKFWQHGRWMEIVVDDYLPYEVMTEKPLFSMTTPNEAYWCPLLEKAFVKFHGTYGNVDKLHPHEVFTNLTGGICETIFPTVKGEDYLTFQHRIKKQSFIFAHSSSEIESKSQHFIRDHVYIITAIEVPQDSRHRVPLIQIKDPGGVVPQWAGNWSNSSIEWFAFPKKDRDHFISNKDDAQCWISYHDFMINFDYVIICNYQFINLMKRNFSEKEEIHWDVTSFEGILNKSHAGRLSRPGQVDYKNASYKFEVLKNEQKPSRPTITLISLCQKPSSSGLLYFGFNLYKVESVKANVCWKNWIGNLKSCYKCENKQGQEVCYVEALRPGIYYIVPFSKDGEECQFLIRIFTEFHHRIPVSIDEPKTPGAFDTNVILSAPIEVELGQPIKISLAVNNKGPKDFKAMAFVGLFSKMYQYYKPIKSQLEQIYLSRKGVAEISLSPALYQDYGPKIDDHSQVCAIFEITGIEETFFDTGIKVINLIKPKIEFDLENSVITSTGINMEATFKNPLPIPIHSGFVTIKGDGIASQKLPFSDLVPFGTLDIKFNCTPEKEGKLLITVILDAIPLGQLKTTVEIASIERK